MQYRQACRVFGLSFSLMSVVTGCGYGENWGWPSYGLPPFEYSAADGSGPSGVIQDSDGNFYGTTSIGGQFNQGTVFRISPDGTETVVYSFAGGPSDGAQPNGGLIQGSNGNFYGTTSNGGIGVCPRAEPVSGNTGESACGTVFTVTPDGAETVLYFFRGTADGGEPNGGLVLGADGNFYGTTNSGGLANSYCGLDGCGVVFKITPGGAETAIYAFGGQTDDGVFPSSLVQGTDGDFYGTTDIGGQPNVGTVFRVTSTGAETLLHSFAGGNDGKEPQAPLVQGNDGSFYGTTYFGGISTNNPVAPCVNGGCGTVFKITAAGAESVLYSFGGDATDGAYPSTALIQGGNGNLYGTTGAGGSSTNCNGGCGVAFSITPAGAETTLYVFAGGTTDGAYPSSSLVLSADGNFYGTTAQGGEFNGGTVFRITPAGVETLLHSFGGSSNTYMNP
jgi:uncharacterized repeat protein (TIGR03803 family)